MDIIFCSIPSRKPLMLSNIASAPFLKLSNTSFILGPNIAATPATTAATSPTIPSVPRRPPPPALPAPSPDNCFTIFLTVAPKLFAAINVSTKISLSALTAPRTAFTVLLLPKKFVKSALVALPKRLFVFLSGSILLSFRGEGATIPRLRAKTALAFPGRRNLLAFAPELNI